MDNMLKMIKSQEKKTPKEIETLYPNCKYILTDFSDLNNINGFLYAVSPDKESFLDLCEVSDELTDEGNWCLQYTTREPDILVLEPI